MEERSATISDEIPEAKDDSCIVLFYYGPGKTMYPGVIRYQKRPLYKCLVPYFSWDGTTILAHNVWYLMTLALEIDLEHAFHYRR